MKITVEAAREYFAHPSQLRHSMIEAPEDLPDWATYYAIGGVCGGFHPGHWSGLLMGHIGVKPHAWGHVTADARAVLGEAWAAENPERIAGWVKDSNRPMQALCRRLGMEIDGHLPLAEPVTLYGWRL